MINTGVSIGPALTPNPSPIRGEGDREARYDAALKLVERIEALLEAGRVHFRDTSGRLLLSLDEVVRAILEDRLVIGDGLCLN